MSNPLGISYALLDPRLELSSCLRCQRQLGRVDRKHESRKAEPHFCGMCGKGLTPEALAMVGPASSGQSPEEGLA